MATFLKNGLFIHIPKTGGRWVQNMLDQHVENIEIWKDRIYNGHESPDANGKTVFAFVRDPGSFCHSLWYHRSRVKKNKFGMKFNWQDYLRLETECKSEDYVDFMNNCANCVNGVEDYYNYYIGKYNDIKLGKTENLVEDFIRILSELNEDFDKESIRNKGNLVIGKGIDSNRNPIPKIERNLQLKINNANKDFCKRMGYDL